MCVCGEREREECAVFSLYDGFLLGRLVLMGESV